MSRKRIWLTWVGDKENNSMIQAVGQALSTNGIDVSGHPWVDNLNQLAWTQLAPNLQDSTSTDAWLIAGEREALEKESVRYGLAALNTCVQGERLLPLFILGVDFEPRMETLPTVLRDAQILQYSDASWGAKIVSKLFRQPKAAQIPYRLSLIANSAFGQWYEVGPAEDSWEGVMFGVTGSGKITHHAVGERGKLPLKTVLEYPAMDIQAQVGDHEFIACSVQNKLTAADSYFIRIDGSPSKLIFAGHPGSEDQEVYIVDMQ